MKITQPIVRLAIPLLALSALVIAGCAADQSSSMEISEAAPAPQLSEAAPAPPSPADFKPPVARQLLGTVDVSVDWIPAGYVETNGQMSNFTLGRTPSENEAPGLVRTWMREGAKQGNLSVIGIVIESSDVANLAVSPRAIAAVGESLRDVRSGTEVLKVVQSTGSHDIRWTEGGLDVKVLLIGDEWDDPSVNRLVSGIRLIQT